MNIEKLFESKRVVYSLEVFPPKKTTSIDTIYNTLYGLRGLKPDFISVTYGAGGSDSQKQKTSEIASLIRSEYGIEPVSHLTCAGSTREDIIQFLSRLKADGVSNVLALRGDITPENGVIDFKHADDLTRFIKKYDESFNVIGACYPEGHCESHSLDEDIENIKRKVDAGASHLISQLFFDNDHFYTFMDKIEKAGIRVPVEAGIMPVVNKSQIERTVSMCGASFPVKFSKMINKYANDAEALKDAGIAFATEQIIDLINNDVRGIHLYTMNRVEVATRITDSISNIIASCNK